MLDNRYKQRKQRKDGDHEYTGFVFFFEREILFILRGGRIMNVSGYRCAHRTCGGCTSGVPGVSSERVWILFSSHLPLELFHERV